MDLNALTKGQQQFLATYLAEVFYGPEGEKLKLLPQAEFVAKVSTMDFDDGEPCTAGNARIAQNLYQKGVFAKVDIHAGAGGSNKFIYLRFSPVSAELLYQLYKQQS